QRAVSGRCAAHPRCPLRAGEIPMNNPDFRKTGPANAVRVGEDAAFTEVHLEYRSNRRYRLLFGAPFDVIDMDHPRPPGGRIAFFRPGDRFGLVLWESNDVGTMHWRVLVCRALRIGER